MIEGQEPINDAGAQIAVRSDNLRTHRGARIKLAPLLSDEAALACWADRIADGHNITVLDLFCGAGGFSAGFRAAGFTVAAGLDSDPLACETFSANFPAKAHRIDLASIESADDARRVLARLGIDHVDVVVGGPPCQGFSVVGRARIMTLQSAEQRSAILERNHLYKPFFHFVEAAEPRVFVVENVQTIRSWESGSLFHDMLERTTKLGYTPYPGTLRAERLGVPQTRRRQFLVGAQHGVDFRYPMDVHAPLLTLQDAIGDLPSVSPPSLVERLPYAPTSTCAYQRLMRARVSADDANYIYDHVVRPVRDDDKEIFWSMKPGQTYADVDERYRRYRSDSFLDKYRMLDPDCPSITITAHIAKDGYRYIHWDRKQCRTLSVREAARIQSFDDAHRFAGYRTNRYVQIGNAVPPLLAERLAVEIMSAIRGRSDRGGRAGDGATGVDRGGTGQARLFPEELVACQ